MDFVITLDRDSSVPLYSQVAEEIRQAILQGRLKQEQKLPSSRTLAESLGISRITVTQSYEQLTSEGYLETRKGSGSYVCSQLPDEWLSIQLKERSPQNNSQFLSLLSDYGRSLIKADNSEALEPVAEISFRYGNPATEQFPVKIWRKLLSRHCYYDRAVFDYTYDPAGYLPLRKAIADYLARSRGVRCEVEQVIIINGSQQGLDLMTRLFVQPGDWVAIEEPGYISVRQCFLGQRAKIQPISVDKKGLKVDVLNQCDRQFKLLYVTPSHQFPTGVVLSLPRRLALLEWAQKTGTLILEDDYDSEFRYDESPIPALQSLDRNDSVVYIGSLSKILFPSLRIGYLIAPPALVPIICQARWLCDRFTSLLEQYALTDFITEGYFERHIRRIRRFYNHRRQVLIKAINEYLGERATIVGENAGIHLIVQLHTNLSEEDIIKSAHKVKIGIISLKPYYLQATSIKEFIFGYSSLTEPQIREGIRRLASIQEL
ncbi:PLP-dependent aminotransferase family protein [Pleurocapsales cyanobacterium LEGE 06147]|nr:PLP-dependent aminotransferase family protein [Pleurocapsales cyanobacterium LEGE 06147]